MCEVLLIELMYIVGEDNQVKLTHRYVYLNWINQFDWVEASQRSINCFTSSIFSHIESYLKMQQHSHAVIIKQKHLDSRKECTVRHWTQTAQIDGYTWVRASFCWIAILSRELRVFFSSSAEDSCLCSWSSWVTYSSHRWANMALSEEKVAASSFSDFNSDLSLLIVCVTIVWNRGEECCEYSTLRHDDHLVHLICIHIVFMLMGLIKNRY